eukprot:353440-Chlamydomonas_euryale.AAC.1
MCGRWCEVSVEGGIATLGIPSGKGMCFQLPAQDGLWRSADFHQQPASTTSINNPHQQLPSTTFIHNFHCQPASTTSINNPHQQLPSIASINNSGHEEPDKGGRRVCCCTCCVPCGVRLKWPSYACSYVAALPKQCSA